jgi:hypothetical protein
MTNVPAGRFVRLSHAEAELAGVTTTFLAAAEDSAPDAESNGILASVAATDPQRAARIQSGLSELIAHDEQVMSWLESDPANAAQFAHDPFAALHAALPELPADFFEGWR